VAVFVVVYPGAAVSSMRLSFDSAARQYPAHAVLGALCAVALGVVPFLLWRNVRGAVGAGKARVRSWGTPLPPKYLQYCLVGECDWVSCHRHDHWTQRWDASCRRYRPACSEGIAAEMLAVWFLALIAGPPSRTWASCGTERAVGAVLYTLRLLYIVCRKPYRRARDAVLFTVITVIVALGLALNAAAFFAHSLPWAFTDLILLCGSALSFLRAVMDGITEAVLFFAGYRNEAQRLEFGPLHQGAPESTAPKGEAQSSSFNTMLQNHPLVPELEGIELHSPATPLGGSEFTPAEDASCIISVMPVGPHPMPPVKGLSWTRTADAGFGRGRRARRTSLERATTASSFSPRGSLPRRGRLRRTAIDHESLVPSHSKQPSPRPRRGRGNIDGAYPPQI